MGPQQVIFSRMSSVRRFTPASTVDDEFDISHQEDVRFSPDFWPESQLPGAPAIGGPHATWMRANGVAERLFRCGWRSLHGRRDQRLQCTGLMVCWARTAVRMRRSTGARIEVIAPRLTFDGNSGGRQHRHGIYTFCTLDGDISVDRNSTSNDASAYFHTCQLITGHNGIAIHMTGSSSFHDAVSALPMFPARSSWTAGSVNFVEDSGFTVAGGKQSLHHGIERRIMRRSPAAFSRRRARSAMPRIPGDWWWMAVAPRPTRCRW